MWTISSIFKASWGTFKTRFRLYVLIACFVEVVTFGLDKLSGAHSPVVSLSASIALMLFSFVIGIGSINLILKDIRKEYVTYNDLFVEKKILSQYVRGSTRLFLLLLPFILIMIGGGVFMAMSLGTSPSFFTAMHVFVALIICVSIFGAAVVGLRYYFFPYIIINEGASAKESIARSKEITQGALFKIFKFCIVVTIINIIGSVLVVGSLVTLPLTMISAVHVYLKMKEEKDGVVAPEENDLPSVNTPQETVQQ